MAPIDIQAHTNILLMYDDLKIQRDIYIYIYIYIIILHMHIHKRTYLRTKMIILVNRLSVVGPPTHGFPRPIHNSRADTP